MSPQFRCEGIRAWDPFGVSEAMEEVGEQPEVAK